MCAHTHTLHAPHADIQARSHSSLAPALVATLEKVREHSSKPGASGAIRTDPVHFGDAPSALCAGSRQRSPLIAPGARLAGREPGPVCSAGGAVSGPHTFTAHLGRLSGGFREGLNKLLRKPSRPCYYSHKGLLLILFLIGRVGEGSREGYSRARACAHTRAHTRTWRKALPTLPPTPKARSCNRFSYHATSIKLSRRES